MISYSLRLTLYSLRIKLCLCLRRPAFYWGIGPGFNPMPYALCPLRLIVDITPPVVYSVHQGMGD